MAREIQHFTATIPAGTPKATPLTVQIPTSVRVVTQIDWRVPTGPMGVFGWNVSMGGVKVFPLGSDTYILANGEVGTWPVNDAPNSGAWEVTGYNTGANPHSVYLAFHCDPVVNPPVRPVLVPATLLMPAPDLSRSGPPVPGRK